MIVVGLMSGTSADGIDAAVARIDRGNKSQRATDLQVQQLGFLTLPWSSEDTHLIEDLIGNQADTRSLCQADFHLGERLAQAARQAIAHAGLKPDQVDLIGSHGQTVWHQVAADGGVESTLQLGEAAVIAERTGITTIADFRVADVAAGGQGAPLIPIFDRLLLGPQGELTGCRAVQNIGGIGNVTFLPGGDAQGELLAFDTGPGNVLMDWAARQITQGAQRFDVDGQLAAQGRVQAKLLARWLAHPYFLQAPPKSTGRELFSQALAQALYQEGLAEGVSDLDFIATVTELTAASIAESYRRFAPQPVAELIVCGGGAHNPVLLGRIMAQIEQRCGWDVGLISYGDLSGVPGNEDSKEALCFALLAWLAVHGEPGNVPSCTGAAGPRVLGSIAPGRNFRELMEQIWGAYS